jgi:hypothetical protein
MKSCTKTSCLTAEEQEKTQSGLMHSAPTSAAKDRDHGSYYDPAITSLKRST